MSNYNFNYSFNISGNCNAVVQEIAENVGNLRTNLTQTTSIWDSFEGKLLALNQFTDYLGNLRNSFAETMAPGAALNASLADLAAISGATGKELDTVEKFARRTAREFGGSASGAVESYKLLLSQLSPELTKNTEALDAMGRNVAILSKTMGGDTTAAAEVLTTAMNQYGVSLEDPMEASRQMADMMNIMAAAGREGSAELPTIKVALEQCGMAAKAAGVSFAETNAAIQVLDKAGKKGSEGGVALRNVMATLAQGRFLPKDVQQELAAAGVSINDLTDQSKTLAERLTILKPVMADSALFSKLFGRENANAAMALVQGTEQVEKWTDAISGTNTAVEQSKLIMETYNEKLARINARFDDIKISIFNCCGDLGIWVEVVAGALIPVSQLIPLVSGLAKAILFLRTVNFKSAFSGVVTRIRSIIAGLMMMNVSLGVTGGFWTAFKVIAQNACRSIGVAIMNIPIVGWIAAGIAVVIAVVQQLWDKCKGFRIAVFTAWEAIKAAGNAVWIILKAIGEQIAIAFNTVKEKIKPVIDFYISMWGKVFNAVGSVFSWIKGAFNNVVGFIASIPARVGAIFAVVRARVAAVADWITSAFRSAVEAIISAWNGICDAVSSAVNWIASTVSAVWNRILEVVSTFSQRVVAIFSSIWEAIRGFALRVAGIFVNVFNRIKGAFTSVRNWIVGVVNAIIAKVKSICAPLVNAFNTVAAKIKSVFGSVLNWVKAKIDSVINWFINLYNKIAEVMNWEKIKSAGKAAGEASWSKDHPAERATPVDADAGTPAATGGTSDAGNSSAGSGGGTSSIGAGLGSIGGKSDKTDRVKNITINIEKLVDTLTISTTNLQESKERIKDIVAEALLSAVNDANYAV
nr:MAG TPA: minor tail protein [Caudoviricetes sp.]